MTEKVFPQLFPHTPTQELPTQGHHPRRWGAPSATARGGAPCHASSVSQSSELRRALERVHIGVGSHQRYNMPGARIEVDRAVDIAAHPVSVVIPLHCITCSLGGNFVVHKGRPRAAVRDGVVCRWRGPEQSTAAQKPVFDPPRALSRKD